MAASNSGSVGRGKSFRKAMDEAEKIGGPGYFVLGFFTAVCLMACAFFSGIP